MVTSGVRHDVEARSTTISNTTIGNIRRQSALAVGGILQRAGRKAKKVRAIFTFDDDASGGGRTMHQLPGLHAWALVAATDGRHVARDSDAVGCWAGWWRSMKPLLWGYMLLAVQGIALGMVAYEAGSPRCVRNDDCREGEWCGMYMHLV